MKIGIITQAYYPIKGGVSEHVHALSGELEKLGHKVTIITGNFTGFDDSYGRHVRRIGRDLTILSNGAFNNINVSLRFKEQLEQIEKEEQFDIIHIHQPIDPMLPLLSLKYFKAPKVGTFHTYQKKNNFWLSTFKNQVQPFFKKLDRCIAVSKPAKEFISRYYKTEYTVIPNGVDTGRFSPEVKPLPEYENVKDFKILFLGRMDPRKGYKYLLKAFPLIYQKLENVRIIVVGSGILRFWYHLTLPEVLRPRVEYKGFVPSEEVPRYYASCDVYCSPATMGESFGIVLLEAMASGKPVVASDIEGYNSLLENGKEGLLVAKKDPLAIAEAISDLARDKKKREQMGKAGRQKSLAYDWKTVTQKIVAVYEDVLKKKTK